ncbi:MAG: C40 family peptidase [Rhodocyclaceae bacterium]|nr:C40 family peptidase [Rhodocyclaceae bacterium]
MAPLLPLALLIVLLAGCGQLAVPPAPTSGLARPGPAPADGRALDVALFALGLVDTGYRFGGKNPQAGLDCSGMVSYVFERAVGMKLAGSAAELAQRGRPVERERLKPGDLVFFNTRNQPYSHVGIYIGDGRFVHAATRAGKVRIDRLSKSWFATRFEEARTYFD